MSAALALRLGGLCLVGAILAAVLRSARPEMELLLVLAVCAAALLAAAPAAEELLALIRRMAAWGELSEDILGPLLKTLGIAVLCRISSDVCRDAGQSAMASLVELGGVLSTLLVAAPLLGRVWELLAALT